MIACSCWQGKTYKSYTKLNINYLVKNLLEYILGSDRSGQQKFDIQSVCLNNKERTFMYFCLLSASEELEVLLESRLIRYD